MLKSLRDAAFAKMTPTEKEICRFIQGDIPVAGRPFQEAAARIGIEESQILTVIRQMLSSGAIRKIGAILRHQRAGFVNNAMVVWAAPDFRCEEAGKILASFSEVTHCYQRVPPFLGRYGLFTMVHFKEENPQRLLEKMREATGISDCLLLRSEQEFKKTSMTYF